MVILCANIGKIDFYVKNRKNMLFFLLNLLENDDSNLKDKVWSAYHFKYFQNIFP